MLVLKCGMDVQVSQENTDIYPRIYSTPASLEETCPGGGGDESSVGDPIGSRVPSRRRRSPGLCIGACGEGSRS